MGRGRTRDVARGQAAVYLRRADALLRAARWGDEVRSPDVVAVNAIQAGISAADAFLVHSTGQRSAGMDPREAIGLVARTDSERKVEVGHQLSRLLDKKAEVEYEDAEVGLATARKLLQSSERLVAAVRAELTGAPE